MAWVAQITGYGHVQMYRNKEAYHLRMYVVNLTGEQLTHSNWVFSILL